MSFDLLPAEADSRFQISLSASQRRLLEQTIIQRRDTFDPEEAMLCIPFSSPGYHTKLTGGMVHPTRESLWYAGALMDTGDEDDELTAFGVFEKVLTLQDTDPTSPTYGIWSWFLEEPLAAMDRPDWNWADFCGALLLEVMLNHAHRFSPALAAKMDEAILHAARSIERRNVESSYTNIAIMGSFVTLVAAESYGLDGLHTYALDRLRRLWSYTKEQGAFTEYNSPTYTIVALDELSRMQRYILDPEAQEITARLYRMAWEEIAQHFHSPTQQWAGPHSRCYQTFLPSTVQTLIRLAVFGHEGSMQEAQSSLEMYRQQHSCPPDLLSQFGPLRTARTVRKTYLKQESPLIGTTYLAPNFTLGSINYSDLWNQRRALLAYWGTAEAPAYLRLQFLHDGYDFSGAWLFSQQKEGQIMAGISFATDGYDRHIHLDPIREGAIEAHDLRLRFEVSGLPDSVVFVLPTSLQESLEFTTCGVTVQLAVPLARWGKSHGYWASSRVGDTLQFDVVLHAGESEIFQLNELTEAALIVAVHISSESTPYLPPTIARIDETYHAHWDGLDLEFSAIPNTMNNLRGSFASGSLLE